MAIINFMIQLHLVADRFRKVFQIYPHLEIEQIPHPYEIPLRSLLSF